MLDREGRGEDVQGVAFAKAWGGARGGGTAVRMGGGGSRARLPGPVLLPTALSGVRGSERVPRAPGEDWVMDVAPGTARGPLTSGLHTWGWMGARASLGSSGKVRVVWGSGGRRAFCLGHVDRALRADICGRCLSWEERSGAQGSGL